MAVKECGVQTFFQRTNLSGHRGLAEVEHVTGMGQAARVRDGVKYSELVPIHTDTFRRC
jgi:hypothetical protein